MRKVFIFHRGKGAINKLRKLSLKDLNSLMVQTQSVSLNGKISYTAKNFQQTLHLISISCETEYAWFKMLKRPWMGSLEKVINIFYLFYQLCLGERNAHYLVIADGIDKINIADNFYELAVIDLRYEHFFIAF